MHPSISINSLSIQAGSLARNVDLVAGLGVCAISPTLEEVDDIGPCRAASLIGDAALKVATFTHRSFGFTDDRTVQEARERLNRTIAIAAEIGAHSITLTTGGRGSLRWPDAVNRFAEAIAPCAVHARQAGVALSVEPTSHLYSDASIAHRLNDLVTICTRANIGLGIDLFACWFDSDIEDAIAAAIPLCQVVQVSDYVAGDRGLPCRAVPGDGIVGLDHLIPLITHAGYRGYYDLELIGPRIDREGPHAALKRAVQRMAELLDRGAG